MSGVEQLNECLVRVLAKLDGIAQKLGAGEGTRAPVEDLTRPMTAEELCERWKVEAETESMQLLYLSRKCRDWGLRPLKGGRGWNALFSRADVRRAEEYAAGKIRGRKTKTKRRKKAV